MKIFDKINLLKSLYAALPLLIIFKAYSYPGAYEDALKLYNEGSYRRSLETLGQSNSGCLENYLLARDYMEMKDYRNSAEEFSRIKPDVLNKLPSGDFFLENYAYYFSLALYQDGFREFEKGSTNIPGIETNILHLVGNDSPLYEDVLKNRLLYEWETGNYRELTGLTLSNTSAMMYRSFASYITGNESSFSAIFNFSNERDFNILFIGITNRIDARVLDLIKPENIPQALTILNKLNMDEKSKYLLERYSKLTNDREFVFINRLYLEYRISGFEKAFELFGKICSNAGPAAEVYYYQYFLGLLCQSGRFESAYEILKSPDKRYASALNDVRISVLARLQKTDELYNWALESLAKGSLDDNSRKRVFREFLQNSPIYARSFAAAALSKNPDDPYLLYISALIDLGDGRVMTAYSGFLKTALYHPFTYEGIVSAEYEKKFRPSFNNEYNKELLSFKQNIGLLDANGRLEAVTGFKMSEPSLYKQWKLSTNIDALLAGFRYGILTNMSDSFIRPPVPPEWISYSRMGLNSYNIEIFNIIDRKLNQPERYRASFNFPDYYRSLGLEGIVVARLNNWITRLCGSREFHPLLDSKLEKALYPLPYFDDIESLCLDTNYTLWILSVFREESHFNKKSISPTGAVGFAQLMPATAAAIKKNMKKADYDCYDFRDNLEIGVFHLKYLFRKYRNDYCRALAAYNAGEPSVNRWIKKYRYGNELWVECIDFEETRDYIKKIIQTRYFYSLIYDMPTSGMTVQ